MKIMVPLFAYQSNGVSKPPRHHMYLENVIEYLALYTTVQHSLSILFVYYISQPMTNYNIKLAVIPFSFIFTGKVTIRWVAIVQNTEVEVKDIGKDSCFVL